MSRSVAAFLFAAALAIVLAMLSADRRAARHSGARTTTAAHLVDLGGSPPDIVITEFLANNRGGLRDEDGDSHGWIELHNPGSEAVSLEGWTLSDDVQQWDKWAFPAATIPPDEYLLVFASGKDRRVPGNPLHTNFRLSDSGEFLGLFNANGEAHPSNTYFPRYPRQRANVAFGRAKDRHGYLVPSTPGEANDTATRAGGLVAPVQFSQDRGFHDRPFTLGLQSASPGAEIRYTVDGAEPTPNSGMRYETPIRIETTTVLRAAAFKEGWIASPSQMHTFVFPDHVSRQLPPDEYPAHWEEDLPADYTMDSEIVGREGAEKSLREALRSLPTLSVATSPANLFSPESGIYLNTEVDGIASERAAFVEFLDSESGDDFAIAAGIRIQGRSSRKPQTSPKHSFRLLFKAAHGAGTLRFPLFRANGSEEFNTLVLRATSNYAWTFPAADQRERALYVRDAWAKDTFRAMGHASPRSRFAHLYLNGLYWGIYSITERPDAAYMASHFGGRDEEYDVIKGAEVVAGDDRAWRTLFAMAADNVERPDVYAQIADRIDVDNFIDYMILNHFAGNENWDYGNWYAARKRATEAKFRFFPWDMESILGRTTESKIYVRHRDRPTELFHRLLKNDTFRAQCAERIHFHLMNDGALTPQYAATRLQRLTDEIEFAIFAESARWGDYRLTKHPYRIPPYQRYTRDAHWRPERARLLDEYFPNRTAIVLEQYRRAGILDENSNAPADN